MDEQEIIIKIRADASEAVDGVQEVKDKVTDLNNTPLDKPFKSFKSEIKEAIIQAQKMEEQFGKNSAQFAEAAKKVTGLKDQFGEFNKSVDSFNPDNKLQALVSLGSAAVGSVQGITGAMTLLGVESEDSGKAIAKLQALMALSGALNSIDEIKNSYKNFGTVIQNTSAFQKANAAATTVTSVAMKGLGFATEGTSIGFKVLKGAIIATGIGALVIGLVALVQNFDSVKKAVLNLIPGLSGIADFIGGIVDSITDFVGATSEAGRATDKLIADNEKAIRASNEFLDANGDKFDQYTQRKMKANNDYRNHVVEVNKDETKSEAEKQELLRQYREKANREINKAEDDRQAKIQEGKDKELEVEKKKAEDAEKVRDEANAKAKAAREKAKAEADKAEQNRIEQEKATSKLILEARLAGITDEFFKKQQVIEVAKQTELDSQFDLLNKKLISEEDFQIRKQAIDTKYSAQQTELLIQKAKSDEEARLKVLEDAKQARLQAAKDNTTNAETNLVETETDNAPNDTDTPEIRIQKLQAIYDAEKEFKAAKFAEELAQADGDKAAMANLTAKYNQQAQEDEKAFGDAVKEIRKEVHADLQAKVTAAGSLLSQASDLAGKHTVAGKALAVAATTINTYQAAMAAFKGMTSSIPGPVGIALGVAAAGLAVATGVANIKKILAVKVPGKDGGGGGAAPSFSAPTINSTMLSPELTKVQDVRVTNSQDTVIKAYISDRDMQANTDKKEFINKLGSI